MQLIAENLSCIRGTKIVFGGVSFSLSDGESLVLTGPNGSGKTSLLRVVAGFIPSLTGQVYLSGAGDEAYIQEKCHYIGHLNGVKPGLTISENLQFYARYLGDEGRAGGQNVDAALEAFSLSDICHIPAGLLSAGQKRRVGLARLLAAPRPIWFLDEPSVSLDQASTDMLASIIGDHLRGGGIVVAATHVPLGLDFAKSLDMREGTRAQEGAA